MIYPNGMRAEMSYEGDARLSKVEHIKQGSVFDQVQNLFSYQYDYNNNKTRMKTFRRALPVNEKLDYTYDKKDQLLTATNPLRSLANETFTYDIAGNLLRQAGQTTDSSYNKNNQLTDDGTYAYKYDVKGNMTEKKHKTNNTVTRYHWDIENQLTRVTKHETETAMPSETITYAYDALGRRIEKNINGAIKRYIYDNEDILMEFNEENAFQRYYVHGLGIDDPLAMLKDNKETRNDLNDLKAYYYHKDGMNSVTSLTDEQANEKEKYIYNAFGKMTVYDERDRKIASSQIGNPYSFTGREHDSETGLHYHRARYYSPELARWINEDPIEFNSGDMNLYRYVENNPLSWIDPIGTVRRRPPKRFTQLVKPKSSVKYLPVRETRAPDVTKYVRHRCYGPQANLCYPEPEPEPEPKPEPVPCTPENPTGDPKKAKPNKFNFYLYFNPNSSPSL